jgi:hypothetical protein
MKLKTLVQIARHIETVLGCSAPYKGATVREVWTALEQAAGHCRTKKEAAREIAEQVYHVEFNGDYPNTESEILAVR